MKPHLLFIKRLKRDFVFILIWMVVGFFRTVPRRVGLSIASYLGFLMTLCMRREYKRSISQLTLAFGDEKTEKEIINIACSMFSHLFMNVVDTARITNMNPADVINLCIPHGMEHVWNIIKRGRGGFFLTSHSGCWELMGAYLTAIGTPAATVARKLYDDRLEKIIMKIRTHVGIKIISRGHNTRDILRSLHKGYMVAFLVDQDIKVKGVFVDFFGRPAHTATAPAQLSLRYHSPVVPIFTYRDKNHFHHICVSKPLEIEYTGNDERDIITLTEQYSKETENFIRAHPEQWVWFHERWKTQEESYDNNADVSSNSLTPYTTLKEYS